MNVLDMLNIFHFFMKCLGFQPVRRMWWNLAGLKEESKDERIVGGGYRGNARGFQIPSNILDPSGCFWNPLEGVSEGSRGSKRQFKVTGH